MSPSMNRRRSGTPYLSATIRSAPMPKAKPGVALGVDAARRQHVRVDHPAAEDLEPALAAAEPATLAAAQAAAHVHLGRRLREREEVRAQPDAAVRAEHLAHEVLERALEIAERDALVDDEPLDLREHRQVAGVGDVAAVHPARHERVDRRLLRLHDAHLDRARVRSQQHVGLARHRGDVSRQVLARRRCRPARAPGWSGGVLSAVKL